LLREIQIRYIAQGNPNKIHCSGKYKYDTLLREKQRGIMNMSTYFYKWK